MTKKAADEAALITSFGGYWLTESEFELKKQQKKYLITFYHGAGLITLGPNKTQPIF